MARRARIPDALARRHQLEKALAPAQALRLAEAYLAEERTVEALAFLVQAEAGDRLQALREQAKLAGDAFLLRQVAAAQGAPPTAEEWQALAEAARAAGKLRYAADAERQADRPEP